MFETAELNQQVSKKDFKERGLVLREALLFVQQRLKHAAFAVIRVVRRG